MSEEAKREYEISFILLPNLKDEEVNSFGEEIRKTIENLDGIFKNQEKPEKRKLAYPIKKFEFGISLNIHFLLAVEKLQELLSILKQNGQILRQMITSVEEKPSFTPRSVETTESKRKKIKPEVQKLKELTKEITGEEMETLKKPVEKKEIKSKETGAKLEDIDKKLDEILGV